jgi:hypothetical protein
MSTVRRATGLTLALLAALAGGASASAESAKPDDPNGYAVIVQFGAREDHDLHPGPGNVIGDVRSGVASSGEGAGVSAFVHEIKTEAGSTPSPPGRS